MSHFEANEAPDASHPFLLTLALASILLFFHQGAISHMMTLLFAIKTSERDLDLILTLLLILALVGLVYLIA